MKRPDRQCSLLANATAVCFLRSLSNDSACQPLNFNSRVLFTSARTSIVSLRTTLVGMSGEGGSKLSRCAAACAHQSMSSGSQRRSIAVVLPCV